MPANPPHIRRAKPMDYDALAGIELRNFSYDRLSPRQMAHHIKNDRAEFWVAVDVASNIECGYALMFTRYDKSHINARIYSIVTDKNFRGRGIGRALMNQLIKRAKVKKAKTLRLEVRARNRAAISLYENLGFAPHKRIPGYYSDGSDAVKMILNLK